MERRLQREALASEALQRRQREKKEALRRAEELRLQGNDVCRQGQLPGNAAAQQHLMQEEKEKRS